MRAGVAALSRMRPPERIGGLLVATMVLSVGKGTFLATVMVYLLGIAGLKPVAAATAMSLWGAASVAVAFPVGALIDRGRGREVGAISAACTAILLPIVAQLDAAWALMLVLCVAGGFDSAGNVVRRAFFAGGTPSGVTALAWARTVTNIGFAAGGLLSVWLLAAHSASAYALAYLLISGVYLLMAVSFVITPLGPRRARAPGSGPAASAGIAAAGSAPAELGAGVAAPRNLRSGASLAAATAILTIHLTLLTTVLPLWITNQASVPVAVLGWLFTLNTLIIVAGQIPVSRLAMTTAGALRCFKDSALWTAACCVLLYLVTLAPPVGQVILLVAATIALTGGELLEAAGEWGLSATFARHGEHGFYQSACVVGEATQSATGPLLAGALITALPVLGWPLLIGLIGVGRFIAGFVGPPGQVAAGPRLAAQTSGDH